jgi:hypothetical protein
MLQSSGKNAVITVSPLKEIEERWRSVFKSIKKEEKP